ncbi:hypothetical protein [Ureibacillus chungkukjangi]|nr:hypothetical protein [Ureibacillus chungkukjangi]
MLNPAGSKPKDEKDINIDDTSLLLARRLFIFVEKEMVQGKYVI